MVQITFKIMVAIVITTYKLSHHIVSGITLGTSLHSVLITSCAFQSSELTGEWVADAILASTALGARNETIPTTHGTHSTCVRLLQNKFLSWSVNHFIVLTGMSATIFRKSPISFNCSISSLP